MIAANELRIGNWVDIRNGDNKYGRTEYLVEPRYRQVESIGYNGINISSSYEGSFECDYKEGNIYGIELTPEILEKCGFEVDRMWYIKDGICLGWITKENFLQVSICHPQTNGSKLYHETIIDVPYVHTLQNYWPAWTGNELNITL